MKLLYICGYQFKICENDVAYARPAYGNSFWDKYLDIFEEILILGEPIRGNVSERTLVKLTDPRIKVKLLPSNSAPGKVSTDRYVKEQLHREISDTNYIMIKMASRKGIMAIRECEHQGKEYMISMSGDLNLDLKTSNSLLKRAYRPFIIHQVKRAMRNCNYGLYVTTSYLQREYPIKGKTCGCTNTILKYIDPQIIDSRISKINLMGPADTINIGLIGTYSNNRKGIDTAIEALNILSMPNVCLHILGIGIENDRKRWYEYARKWNVEQQLIFDEPIKGVDNVLKWDDEKDLIILPSRSEGLPRCIIEAISRAVPCIISNVCGCPELVDPKWLHNPGDSETLAKLIKDMLDHKTFMCEAASANHRKSYDYLYETVRERRNRFLKAYVNHVASGQR